MARLKVGDKLEVMVDYPESTSETRGTILIVMAPDGFNPSCITEFQTNSTTSTSTA